MACIRLFPFNTISKNFKANVPPCIIRLFHSRSDQHATQAPNLYLRNVEGIALKWLHKVDDPCQFFAELRTMTEELPNEMLYWHVVYKRRGKVVLCGVVPTDTQNGKAHSLFFTAAQQNTTADFPPVVMCVDDRPHPLDVCPTSDFVSRLSIFSYAHYGVPQDVPRTLGIPSLIFHDDPFPFRLGKDATSYDGICDEIQRAGQDPPTHEQLVWRGNAGNHPVRQRLLYLSKRNPEYLDVQSSHAGLVEHSA